MRELLTRVGAGPAIIVVIEHEAPTRIIFSATENEDDARRLVDWVWSSDERRELIKAALAASAPESGRARAWVAELAREPGGIHAAIERLLTPRDQPAA